jgi:hypothetical protein
MYVEKPESSAETHGESFKGVTEHIRVSSESVTEHMEGILKVL